MEIKVISGGQTGADQAGLYAARDCGITTGGYAPANFMTKEGPNFKLRDEFGLFVVAGGYKMRTQLNVKSSDITLRFAYNFNSPGERCTMGAIINYHKPYKDFFLTYPINDDIIQETSDWINYEGYKVINVAGNTQTKKYDTFTPVYEAMCKILKGLKK
jgi:hypothetical protein